MCVFGQNNSSQLFELDMTKFPSKTPEASAFMYQGKDEISEYTGNPNISIPLLSLEEKDINIPITLSYKGEAIKVDEEASWVGLGWNLSIGGCINLIPSGKIEHRSTIGWDRDKFHDLYTLPDTAYMNIVEGIRNDYRGFDLFNNETLYTNHGEVDLYSVSVLGKSLLFYIDPLSQPSNPNYIIVGENTECFEIEEYNNGGWIIRDGDGFEYTFSPLGCEKYDLYGATHPSAWYITSIISPKGNRVSFAYTYNTIKKHSRRYTYIQKKVSGELHGFSIPNDDFFSDGPKTAYSPENMYFQQPSLDSIYSDNWSVTFYKSDREDLATDTSLYLANCPQKLDSIFFRSKYDINIKKHIQFTYDYFDKSGDILSKRLKLCSLGIGGKEKIYDKYSFGYDKDGNEDENKDGNEDENNEENNDENNEENNEENNKKLYFPLKNEENDDHWGCINGSRSNTKQTRYFPDLHPESVSPQNITTGMLTKITYPTGGFSRIEYEPHDFDDNRFHLFTPTGSIHRYASDTHNERERKSVPFDLDKKAKGIICFRFSNPNGLDSLANYGAAVKILRIGSGIPKTEVDIKIDTSYISSHPNSTVFTDTVKLELSSGQYALVTYLPDNISGGVSSWISVKTYIETDHSVGGGVRTKAILNYDSNNELSHYSEFEYKNTDGTTSGKLLYPMLMDLYHEYKPYRLDEIGRCWYAIVGLTQTNHYGKSNTAFTDALLGGRTIGYSTVTKREFDKDSILIRKIITEYSNTTTYKNINNLFHIDTCNIGRVISQTIYDSSGNEVKQISNQYDTSNECSYLCSAHYSDYSICYESNGYIAPIECYAITYRLFRNWPKLTVNTTIDYENGEEVSRSTTSYTYNNINKQISSITQKIQNTPLLQTRFYYDTSSNNKTYWNFPTKIEEYEISSNGYFPPKRTIETDYCKKYRRMYVPIEKRLYKAGSNLANKITYEYDGFSNLVEEVLDSINQRVFLWGYNYQYPVAEIIGATRDEIGDWLTEPFIATIATCNENVIDEYLSSLRNRLSGYPVQITTYTYLPLVGIKSITEPNGNFTSFEYDDYGRLVKTNNNGILNNEFIYHQFQQNE